MMRRRVLFVDDDSAFCQVVGDMLKRSRFELVACTNASEALAALAHEAFDVVVTDLQMPRMDGLEFCKRVLRAHPGLPVIVLTAFGSMQTAISALRAGARDFIQKPMQIGELLACLALVLEVEHTPPSAAKSTDAACRHEAAASMIGDSPSMRKLFDLIQRISRSDVTALITGESGTGKELVARALHDNGPRHAGPFVAINCAAVPEGVLESELFGHVRGAFTGAVVARAGLFRQASGGTLFLDEITEMPLGMQVKLLRALQEHTVRAVGSDREQAFDVRVLTATNRNLEVEVAEHRFREDLYYRVHVLRIDVPALRERGADVLCIAEHFLQQFGARANKPVRGLTPEATAKLSAYDWPGNVRELQNCIERAVALACGERIGVEDLPAVIVNFNVVRSMLADNPDELLPLFQIEKQYILDVLRSVNGHKSAAAKLLGVNRRTLHRKLKAYHED
ncbi:MAG TPA: sigma-54 dependent transcriptional regulator [Polyangiales bacterium]|nr:sigma-54 dependent transcriptional regulator [Polyangiales bacterium]